MNALRLVLAIALAGSVIGLVGAVFLTALRSADTARVALISLAEQSLFPSWLGAYFPDWLFCIVAGVSLTVIVHVFSSEKSLGRWLTPLALTYPVLTTLFSLVVWLVFFEN